jgi:hypothetical protein
LSGGGFRGGDVPSGSGPRESESLFADVTAGSGIDFTHNNGAGGRLLLPEIMGAGGALFDYDPPAWPSAAPGRPGAEVWHDPQTTR